MEQIKLIKLQDKSKNLIANGHLLIKTATTTTTISQSSKREPNTTTRAANSEGFQSGNSQLIVIPLRSVRNEACKLILQVYCCAPGLSNNNNSQPSDTKNSNNPNKSGPIYRIHSRLIEVPRYCMFALIDLATQSQTPKPKDITHSQADSCKHWPKPKVRVSFPLRDVETTLAQVSIEVVDDHDFEGCCYCRCRCLTLRAKLKEFNINPESPIYHPVIFILRFSLQSQAFGMSQEEFSLIPVWSSHEIASNRLELGQNGLFR